MNISSIMLTMDTDDVTLIFNSCYFLLSWHAGLICFLSLMRRNLASRLVDDEGVDATGRKVLQRSRYRKQEVTVNHEELEIRQNLLFLLKSRLYKSRWFFTEANCLPEVLCVQFKKPRTRMMVSHFNSNISRLHAIFLKKVFSFNDRLKFAT